MKKKSLFFIILSLIFIGLIIAYFTGLFSPSAKFTEMQQTVPTASAKKLAEDIEKAIQNKASFEEQIKLLAIYYETTTTKVEIPELKEEIPSNSASLRCRAFSTEVPVDLEGNPRSFSISLQIPVVWHTITSSDGNEGNYSKEAIIEQLELANKMFADARISFRLKEQKIIPNDDWFKYAGWSSDLYYEMEMQKSCRPDVLSCLNVYTVKGDDIFLGVATFPWEGFGSLTDGVIIKYNTLPALGGGGKTLLHEIGHYLGLLHTFHAGAYRVPCFDPLYNACNGKDDLCEDTPRQRQCYFGQCLIGEDSCPYDGEEDPFNNIMGYKDDNCMIEFTPCQCLRMRKYLLVTRCNLLGACE